MNIVESLVVKTSNELCAAAAATAAVAEKVRPATTGRSMKKSQKFKSSKAVKVSKGNVDSMSATVPIPASALSSAPASDPEHLSVTSHVDAKETCIQIGAGENEEKVDCIPVKSNKSSNQVLSMRK